MTQMQVNIPYMENMGMVGILSNHPSPRGMIKYANILETTGPLAILGEPSEEAS